MKDFQVIKNNLLKTAAAPHWKRIEIKDHHGINVPLFSLYSQSSAGIGEFLDLIPLITFCKEVGMDVIQLLPLNDTGKQTSPYSALSSLALNPLHLSLWALPDIDKLYRFEEKLGFLKTFTKKARVDYEPLFALKMLLLKDYFSMRFEQIEKSASYQNFLEENSWLENYALFKAIKESQEYRSWQMWPLHLRSPSQQHLSELLKKYHSECNFHIFLQFCCFEQMRQVRQRADQAGILLKGDLPILISKDSAEVWGQRYNFLLNVEAGAPPDQYAATGQCWGFPLYDWEAIEKHHWDFWAKRLQVAEQFYHLYRLDHVVGFFRMWAIPLGKKASDGYFMPAEEKAWLAQGKEILKHLLDLSLMLPIAEDLGTVPPAVRACLKELGIAGTKVMRWERRWDIDKDFIDETDYESISMTTVSTHDSDTLALWWRHNPKEAQLFAQSKQWHYRPFLSESMAEQILSLSHHSASLFHINLLNEYLALIPHLTATHAADERINIPGEVLPTNWTYRFRLSVEELCQHEDLKKKIRSIIK